MLKGVVDPGGQGRRTHDLEIYWHVVTNNQLNRVWRMTMINFKSFVTCGIFPWPESVTFFTFVTRTGEFQSFQLLGIWINSISGCFSSRVERSLFLYNFRNIVLFFAPLCHKICKTCSRFSLIKWIAAIRQGLNIISTVDKLESIGDIFSRMQNTGNFQRGCTWKIFGNDQDYLYSFSSELDLVDPDSLEAAENSRNLLCLREILRTIRVHHNWVYLHRSKLFELYTSVKVLWASKTYICPLQFTNHDFFNTRVAYHSESTYTCLSSWIPHAIKDKL